MAVTARRSCSATSAPAALIEGFPHLFGERAPRRVILARHSRIDEFAPAGQAAPVIVKTITDSVSHEHAAGVAGREFASLGWLSARMSPDLRASIPEPLAWIPDTCAFAMRKVEGVTVAALLRRHATRLSPWGGPRLLAAGARIGAWLRSLHDATRSADAPLDAIGLRRTMHRSLAAAVLGGLGATEAGRVRTAVHDALERLAASRVPMAARQGDFTVSNILLDGAQVRMVDFENFAECDAIYEDIASFTAYLRMLEASALYSPRHLSCLRHAFLDGYGQAACTPVLGLYELTHALGVLAQFPRRHTWRGRRRRAALERGILSLAGALGAAAPPADAVSRRPGAGR